MIKKVCPLHPLYLERGVTLQSLALSISVAGPSCISLLQCNLGLFVHKVQVLGVGEMGLQDKNRV